MAFEFGQSGMENSNFAVMFSEGLKIKTYDGIDFFEIDSFPNDKFVDMKVGKNKLFAYTLGNKIYVYHFPSANLLYQIDLS